MRRLTYLEGFRAIVRRYPDREALRTPDGRSFTYGELDRRADALAAALEARLPGERCAVLAGNSVAMVESMLAAMKRGRANVQLSTRAAPGELAEPDHPAVRGPADRLGAEAAGGPADHDQAVIGNGVP